MADYHAYVDGIRVILQSGQLPEEVALRELAAGYARVCAEANERLVGGLRLLDQGLRAVAIHQAEIEPNLLSALTAQLHLNFRYFPVGNRRAFHTLDLLVHKLFQLSQIDTRPGCYGKPKERRPAPLLRSSRNIDREFFFFDELLIEPRRHAAR